MAFFRVLSFPSLVVSECDLKNRCLSGLCFIFQKQCDGEAEPLRRLRPGPFSCLHPVMIIGQVVKISRMLACISGYKEHFLTKTPKATIEYEFKYQNLNRVVPIKVSYHIQRNDI